MFARFLTQDLLEMCRKLIDIKCQSNLWSFTTITLRASAIWQLKRTAWSQLSHGAKVILKDLMTNVGTGSMKTIMFCSKFKFWHHAAWFSRYRFDGRCGVDQFSHLRWISRVRGVHHCIRYMEEGRDKLQDSTAVPSEIPGKHDGAVLFTVSFGTISKRHGLFDFFPPTRDDC